MMRGGAMRNRAPRFFWWLRFVAHFFGSRRMRGIHGNFLGGWIFLNTNLTNFAKKGSGAHFFCLTQNARNTRNFLGGMDFFEHESHEFREKGFWGSCFCEKNTRKLWICGVFTIFVESIEIIGL